MCVKLTRFFAAFDFSQWPTRRDKNKLTRELRHNYTNATATATTTTNGKQPQQQQQQKQLKTKCMAETQKPQTAKKQLRMRRVPVNNYKKLVCAVCVSVCANTVRDT